MYLFRKMLSDRDRPYNNWLDPDEIEERSSALLGHRPDTKRNVVRRFRLCAFIAPTVTAMVVLPCQYDKHS